MSLGKVSVRRLSAAMTMPSRVYMVTTSDMMTFPLSPNEAVENSSPDLAAEELGTQ
jgi:hypothetical protein